MAIACPIIVDQTVDVWPRIFRWSKSNRSRAKGAQRFNISGSQHQLEMRSPESIIWKPYETSMYRHNDFITYAYHLSGLRMIFWDPLFKGFWYLGDRAFRQLTGQICIADNPPRNLSSVPQSEYQAALAQNWPLANAHTSVVTQEEYDIYWKAVSQGPLLPAMARYVNVDLIGVGTVAPSTLHIPRAPAPINQPSEYHTQFASAGPTQTHAPRQSWTVDVGLPQGASYERSVPRPEFPTNAPPAHALSQLEWRSAFIDAADNIRGLRHLLLTETREREDRIEELERQLAACNVRGTGPTVSGPSYTREDVYVPQPSHPYEGYQTQQSWGSHIGDDPMLGPHVDLGQDYEFGQRPSLLYSLYSF